MSMHIEGPWLSTTSTKKRNEKVTKAKQVELEAGWRERNARLKEMSLPKETFEQYLEWVYGRGKKTKTDRQAVRKGITLAKGRSDNGNVLPNSTQASKGQGGDKSNQVAVPKSSETVRTKEWITGPVASKPSPVYTGTKVIGIGTMHKSNAVPIFSDEEAKDISTMRRG